MFHFGVIYFLLLRGGREETTLHQTHVRRERERERGPIIITNANSDQHEFKSVQICKHTHAQQTTNKTKKKKNIYIYGQYKKKKEERVLGGRREPNIITSERKKRKK